jgi:hypothetical protein
MWYNSQNKSKLKKKKTSESWIDHTMNIDIGYKIGLSVEVKEFESLIYTQHNTNNTKFVV